MTIAQKGKHSFEFVRQKNLRNITKCCDNLVIVIGFAVVRISLIVIDVLIFSVVIFILHNVLPCTIPFFVSLFVPLFVVSIMSILVPELLLFFRGPLCDSCDLPYRSEKHEPSSTLPTPLKTSSLHDEDASHSFLKLQQYTNATVSFRGWPSGIW